MTIQPPQNKNYCAIVTELTAFVDLPNCDNVKAALIFGNSVIVAKSASVGEVGLFFPVETQLDTAFCGANNLFRKPEWGNADATKKGFFEQHGRVKAVKFRGHKSEGFWIPISCLEYVQSPVPELPVGTEFDTIAGATICRKYVPKSLPTRIANGKAGRLARAEDRIVEGQFRFHIDTENLRRNSHKLDPDTFISISEKWHGTSAVFAKVLVKRKLNWFERLLRRFGVAISETTYGTVWSSRRVVKGVDGAEKAGAVHYYGSDIWGAVAREVQDRIPKGYTVYGEIVGYTPDGAAIQKGYHYGCEVGSHRFLVYRVTAANEDGKVLELSWQQVKDFCAKNGFEMVRELFYGRAAHFAPTMQFDTTAAWQGFFMAELHRQFVNDQMCPHNRGEVPAEGIVLKVDRLSEAEAYKLKNFRFLEWETKALDSGEADIETVESESVAN